MIGGKLCDMKKSRPEALFTPLLSLGPASRPSILAKTPRGLNLGTSENFTSKHSGEYASFAPTGNAGAPALNAPEAF